MTAPKALTASAHAINIVYAGSRFLRSEEIRIFFEVFVFFKEYDTTQTPANINAGILMRLAGMNAAIFINRPFTPNRPFDKAACEPDDETGKRKIDGNKI
jgi:hypothetical protein